MFRLIAWAFVLIVALGDVEVVAQGRRLPPITPGPRISRPSPPPGRPAPRAGTPTKPRPTQPRQAAGKPGATGTPRTSTARTGNTGSRRGAAPVPKGTPAYSASLATAKATVPAAGSPQVLQAKANARKKLLAMRALRAKLLASSALAAKELDEKKKAEEARRAQNASDTLIVGAAIARSGADSTSSGGGAPPGTSRVSGPQPRGRGLTPTFNSASGAAFRRAVPVDSRRQTVHDWYKRHPDIATDTLAQEYVAGTDLSKAVFIRRLQKGERVQVWVPKGKVPGKHFTVPGTGTNRLGINGDRVLETWVVEEEFDVLESTAADFPEGKYEGIGGPGGGQQLVMPPDWNTKMKRN